MNNFFLKISFPLEKSDYKQLILILILTLICAILELVGIGLIIPILNIFAGNNIEDYIKGIDFLKNRKTQEILILTIILLGILYLFKFFLMRLLIFKQFNFRWSLFVKISRKFYKKYLNENYIFHIQNNSSKLIRNISGEANMFSMGVVQSLVTLCTEILIFSSICILLLFYDFKTSIITISFLSFFGYIILKNTSTKLKFWGEKRQFHSSETLKQLQHGFKSIREIILNKLQDLFLNKYNHHNLETAEVNKKRDVTAAMPRLVLELIGISAAIILILFQLSLGNNISEIFVTVGVFLYAALRLLPNVSKIVQSIQSIKYYSPVVDLVFNELKNINDEEVNDKRLENFENISLNNVKFYYPESKGVALENINIKINKGDKIAIYGKTGSGKSTLVNLISGLINQNSGEILLNSKISLNEVINDWRNSIGYVPQTVSIIDESILFNVTLEEDPSKIDLKKVDNILRTVDMYDHVYNLEKNVYESAGENGIKLSVGQNQRLGIARAIYRDPSILILDEATSSLDEKTEKYILDKLFTNINKKTIIFISHRINSLKYCNRFFKVENNKVLEEKSI